MSQSRHIASQAHAQPANTTTLPGRRATPSPGAAMQRRLGATGTRLAMEAQAKAAPYKRGADKPKGKGQQEKGPAAKGGAGKTAGPAPGAQVEPIVSGTAGASPGLPMHMPEPPDRPSPDTMKRLQATQSRAGNNASTQAQLPDAEAQTGAARSSVMTPAEELAAKAQQELINEMKASPSPEIEQFCTQVKEDIRKRRPPKEEDVVNTDPAAIAKDVGGQLDSNVKSSTKDVQQNYQGISAPPGAQATPPTTPLAPQPAAAPAAAINAAAATPSAVPAENISLDKDAAESKAKMTKAGMDTEPAKLVKSGPIADAHEAQGDLDKTAKEDPALVLAKQKQTLAAAKSDMAALGASALAALRASRQSTVGRTETGQKGMVGSEAQQRAAASKAAEDTFGAARTAVEALIKDLPEKSMAEWEADKAVHCGEFKKEIDRAKKEIEARYDGWGVFHHVGDYFGGMPKSITDIYDNAEKAFGNSVTGTIRRISINVNAIILACEKIIKTAKDKIKGIFDQLPASLRDWAAGEQEKFSKQLDKLQDQAHATRDNFNKGLIEQASKAVNEVRAEIAELRKKAGGLLGRIVDAVNEFLDDPAKFIIEGLLKILGIPPSAFWAVVAKIKKCIKDIADDPMNFANNLMSGLSQGFTQFFDNFGTHMLKGFVTWLVGDLKGVQLPKDFSLKSIVTFFLQLMGITWPNIRAILAKKAGEKNIALIEKAWSMISLLMEKGPEGIFEMIKEKLNPETILNQVIEMAVEYMVTAIAKNVAARLLLLFNPAGAIIQALEAIYRVLKWIFQNAARIFRLVETVVNGIANIIAGNIGGFATAVENALAMLIPPVIAFIADYFNMGDLPKVIAAQVKKMQSWVLGHIESAVDWVIAKGKELLSAVGIGGKKNDQKEASAPTVGDDIEFEADGETHHLWIDTKGSAPTVMVASKADSLEHFLNGEAVKNAAGEDPKVASLVSKAQGELAALKPLATAAAKQPTGNVQPASQPSTGPLKSAENKLAATIKLIMIEIAKAGKPFAGLHGVIKKASSSKRGSKRQSHHVPAQGFGRAMVEFFENMAQGLARDPWNENDLARQTARKLRERKKIAASYLTGEADQLSAISLTHAVHMRGVHSVKSSVQQESNAYEKGIMSAKLRIANKYGNYFSVNPRRPGWRQFLADIYRQSKALEVNLDGPREKTRASALIAQNARAMLAETEKEFADLGMLQDTFITANFEVAVNTTIAIAVNQAYDGGAAVVTAALSAKGKGKAVAPKDREAALVDLKQAFTTSWAAFKEPL